MDAAIEAQKMTRAPAPTMAIEPAPGEVAAPAESSEQIKAPSIVPQMESPAASLIEQGTEAAVPEVRTAKAIAEGSSPAEPGVSKRAPMIAEKFEGSVLEEPRAGLLAFLNAPNWKERLKYTQNSRALEAQMEEYYQHHADGPVKTDSIDYLTTQSTPDGNGQFHLFEVHGKDGFGYPVSVEKMDGNFRVDWRSFVEFKDLLLPKFFEQYSPESATFHVQLHRAHYFGSDVPNQDRKLCFAVEPPIAGFLNYAWIEKMSTDIISKLGPRAEFGATSYPIVTLRWIKEKDGSAYVVLTDIVADNWRSDNVVPIDGFSKKEGK